MKTILHACEQRELPTWVTAPERACREVGVRFIRDATGYGHWVCPQHEGIVRAFFNGQRAQ